MTERVEEIGSTDWRVYAKRLAQAEKAMKTQDETHHRCEKEMDERLAQAERERDEQAAKHADCCVDRQELAEARAEVERLKEEWKDSDEQRERAYGQRVDDMNKALNDLARVRAVIQRELGEHRASCFGPPCETCVRLVEARATLECHCPSDPRGGHQPHCLRFRAALEGRG